MPAILRVPALPAALLFAVAASAGELRIGSPIIEGGRYTFPILLDGTSEVSALNFRLDYDPAVFQPAGAATGSAAVAADKTVTSHAPREGALNVVLMGFNQNGVAPGEVARVTLESRAELVEPSRLTIEEVTFANGAGEPLAAIGDTEVVRPDEATRPSPDPEGAQEAPEAPDAEGAAEEPVAPPGDAGGRGTNTPGAGLIASEPITGDAMSALPGSSTGTARDTGSGSPGAAGNGAPGSLETARAGAQAAREAVAGVVPESAGPSRPAAVAREDTAPEVAAQAVGTTPVPLALPGDTGEANAAQDERRQESPAAVPQGSRWLLLGCAGAAAAVGLMVIVLKRGASS